MAVTCANCGTQNPDGNKFCQSCGKPLAAAPVGAAGAPPPAPIPTPTQISTPTAAPAPSAMPGTPPTNGASASSAPRITACVPASTGSVARLKKRRSMALGEAWERRTDRRTDAT